MSAAPSPILPRHPLDNPRTVKIALGQTASEALANLGPCLVIAIKADSTAPEAAQGRMILHCMPITKELSNDAYRVARGTHRAVKIKKPSILPASQKSQPPTHP